jgi:cytochrome oxidase Cu insertion factor (SCO1/SenC/PrrC family)
MKRLALMLMTLFLLGAVACSGATTPTAEPAVPDTATMTDTTMDSEMADSAESTDESMTEGQHDTVASDDLAAAADAMAEDTMAAAAAWQTVPVTNARTGETFTLGDFAGKTVFVEPMATWCSNCRQQLTNVQQARTQINSDDVVFIALSVETTISNEELAQYADNLGFDWTFAVMSPELLQALSDEFGRTITNPPSTPHFVIRPDGSVSDLVTGVKSAEAIVAQTSN